MRRCENPSWKFTASCTGGAWGSISYGWMDRPIRVRRCPVLHVRPTRLAINCDLCSPLSSPRMHLSIVGFTPDTHGMDKGQVPIRDTSLESLVSHPLGVSTYGGKDAFVRAGVVRV